MPKNSSDYFLAGVFVGAGFLAAVFMFSSERDHSEWVKSHDGIQTLVVEMKDECESRPGVIECVWNEDELDFVEVDR